MDSINQDIIRCELKTFLSWKHLETPTRDAVHAPSELEPVIVQEQVLPDHGYSMRTDVEPQPEPARRKRKPAGKNPNEKAIRKPKTFRLAWLENVFYKGWLRPIDDKPTHAFCFCCQKTLLAGKSELDKHSVGTKHKENEDRMKKESTGYETFKMPGLLESENKRKKLESNVKFAEIKISSFFSEHNVPFQVVDQLVPLLKEILPDSEIAQTLQLGRTKCTCIVKNVLAKSEYKETIIDLQNTEFTIMFDRGSICKKYFTILGQYVSPLTGKVNTKLIELITLGPNEYSGEGIYRKVESSLRKNLIPLENVIGLSCDFSNKVISEVYFNCLKSVLPQILLFKCVIKSVNTVACLALPKLPKFLEELTICIAKYPYNFGKKTKDIDRMQTFCATYLKNLELIEGNMLTQYACCSSFLEFWDAIEEYFKAQAVQITTPSSDFIQSHLENPLTKPYFLFLKHILGCFDAFKKVFQTKNIQIHEVYDHSKALFHSVGQNFLTAKCLQQNFTAVDIFNGVNHIPVAQIQVGIDCEDMLKLNSHEMIFEFKKTCLEYYIVACDELRKRLPIQTPLFKEFKFISAKVAFNHFKHPNIHLDSVCNIFEGRVDGLKAVSEWNNLLVMIPRTEAVGLGKMGIDEMWYRISLMRNNVDGSLLFENVAKLAQLVMSVPHSNDECDRIFEVVNEIKTIKRNKISLENLNAAIMLRAAQKSTDLKVNEMDYKSLFNVDMYDHKK